MSDLDLDLDEDHTPDGFDTDGECWAHQKARVPIGTPTHTHVCRELVDDDDGQHPGNHRCGCGVEF